VSPERVAVEVEGRRLSLSNLAKPMYPDTGFTKRDVLDYYARVAPTMLPHLARRPVTLRRYPGGTGANSFFEKRVPAHAPEWVTTATVPLHPHGQGPQQLEALVVADTATLIWAANLAALEFHVTLWRVPAGTGALPGPPDYLVFDLDPGPGTSIVECCRVAGWIAGVLAERGMARPGAKTSGSKGLQLYAPLPPAASWDTARVDARDIAAYVEAQHRDEVVTNMRKKLRHGRVLIDWSQNHPAKTTVAAYSLRAGPAPTASTPVTWDEIAACAEDGDPALLRFAAPAVLDRIARLGDLMPAPRGDADARP
jgi:bifunctional non-homologous end joining protein LigD